MKCERLREILSILPPPLKTTFRSRHLHRLIIFLSVGVTQLKPIGFDWGAIFSRGSKAYCTINKVAENNLFVIILRLIVNFVISMGE